MKNRNLIESLNNAINGIIHVIRREKNMRIHLAAAIATFLAGLFFKLSGIEFAVIFITIALVIVCELFNTAVETVVDIIVDVYHPKAKIVKDIAAGAVMISALNSLIVAYFIFFERASSIIEKVIMLVRHLPMYITVIALLLVLLAVIATKAFAKTARSRGGIPSTRSAMNFAITTAIALWTNEAKLTLLALIMALLLTYSGLGKKNQSIWEVVSGALLGTSITLLLFQLFNIKFIN